MTGRSEREHLWERSFEPGVWFCLRCLTRTRTIAALQPCIALDPGERQTPISGS